MTNIKLKTVNVNEYEQADSGRIGKAFERCFTKKRACKAQGRVDYWHDKKRFEIKTGAGEIKDIKAPYVLYCPVVLLHADGTIATEAVDGWLVRSEDFINALDAIGAIRYGKRTTAGTTTTAIQTFWNRKQNKPHGRLLDRMYDALDEVAICTIDEILA